MEILQWASFAVAVGAAAAAIIVCTAGTRHVSAKADVRIRLDGVPVRFEYIGSPDRVAAQVLILLAQAEQRRKSLDAETEIADRFAAGGMIR